jgi:hypothetical protein
MLSKVGKCYHHPQKMLLLLLQLEQDLLRCGYCLLCNLEIQLYNIQKLVIYNPRKRTKGEKKSRL